jgi:SAM-dependent methyltransferase
VPFEELKRRQSEIWGSAPFENIARNLADMHATVVATLGGGQGKHWLDIGCGTGELARLAAATGASVTGCDLSPVLVQTARRQAVEAQLELAFDVADAEALPYPDASFDLVSSTVGAIFAPDHAVVAAELARVCRPGGRLALTAWTSEGHIASFFALVAEYSPAGPPGGGNPMDWGRPEYAESLLGEAFAVSTSKQDATWRAPSAQHMVNDFATSFGPIKTLLAALPPARGEELLRRLGEDFETYRRGDQIEMARPYTLIEGVRRDEDTQARRRPSGPATAG